jgi:hypothetical protein
LLLAGSAFWLLGEVNHKYPWFWQPAFGWSLLLSNLLAAPLMCLAGLWLEGDLRSDYSGAFGLVALTYILAPYQGYAALRGLLEGDESGWIRTLKTGSVTDSFLSLRLRGLLRWFRLSRLSRLSVGFDVPSIHLPREGDADRRVGGTATASSCDGDSLGDACMSRYYTIHESSVYVYATAGDSLLDLRTIPEGVGLFSAEVPWRASLWVAVSEEAPVEGLRVIELLLRAEGYSRVDVGVEALEDYFTRGDERRLRLLTPEAD